MADVAARYAEALLMAAKQEKALIVVSEEMEFLSREFAQCADSFYSPVFSIREQLSTVDYVMGENFHPLTKRFFYLLASMRRLGGVVKITDIFITLAHKEMMQIDLYLTVFEEITSETAAKIVRAAGEKGLYDLRYREKLNLHISQDKRLLGGFIAECEGISWDCSLLRRLSDVSKVMQGR